MDKIARRLAGYAITKGAIKEEESAEYVYGFTIALEMCLGLMVSFLIAYKLHTIIEGIFFFAVIINEKYGQEIGVESVDTSKVSIEEFEAMATSLAIQQRELKECIRNRETYVPKGMGLFSTLSTTKTVSNPSWQSDAYTITATYDVNGTFISNPRDIKISARGIMTYTCNHGSPTTSIIDSGRTLTVSAYGTVQGGGATFTNVYVYTEFYYDS